jgi:hypothetical protein
VIVDSLTSNPEEKQGVANHHHQSQALETELTALRQEIQDIKKLLQRQ